MAAVEFRHLRHGDDLISKLADSRRSSSASRIRSHCGHATVDGA
jgi:hypothetical protein